MRKDKRTAAKEDAPANNSKRRSKNDGRRKGEPNPRHREDFERLLREAARSSE